MPLFFRKIIPVIALALVVAAEVCAARAATGNEIVVRTIQETIDLGKLGWKFRPGDNQAWSAADFDDRTWETAEIRNVFGRRGNPMFEGFGWLRLTVRFPPEAERADWPESLGLGFGRIEYGGYEVFVNGNPTGRFGTLPPSSFLDPLPRQTVFGVPSRLISTDGRLVIAVRVWRGTTPTRHYAEERGNPGGWFALGGEEGVRLRIDNLRNKLLLEQVPHLVFIVLFVFVGLYHLQLHRRRPQLTEYLWYGLMTLCFAANVFFVSIWHDGVVRWITAAILARCALHGLIVTAVLFGWPFMGRSIGPPLKGYILANLGLIPVTVVFPELAMTGRASTVVYAASLLPLLIGGAVLLSVEAWRGNPEARTVGIGAAVLMGFGLIEVGRGFLSVGDAVVNYSYLGLGAFVISMAASLANRFSRVHAELDDLNRGLEIKVEERTRQLEAAKEEAENANRAKSVFLSNMSHELRTPLNAVLGFAQLMERDPKRPREDRENLSTILRSGEHLLGLINDVLSISKIEAGKLTLNAHPFDLHALLRGLEEMFRLRAEDKGLTLSLETGSDVPRVVTGDEGKLRQTLINLLGNAVKFTSAGRVALRVGRNENLIRFEVEDTGEGIPETELDKLFQAFSQTSSGQRSNEGTGLGLALSRNFVRLMGGDIRVESRVGRGSKFGFEIELPATSDAGAVSASRRVVGLESDSARPRFLIADDQPDNRQLLVKTLSSVGFTSFFGAANGREAVESWRVHRPEIVFMDMRMPVMDGYEATRRIRETENEKSRGSSTPNPEPRTPIIVALTASAFDEDKPAILAAGCDDFLFKPFREADLFSMLEKRAGVKFRYETESRNESVKAARAVSASIDLSGRLAVVAMDWRDKFKRALIEGRMSLALELLDELAETDSALASALRESVRGYQFDKILEALQ